VGRVIAGAVAGLVAIIVLIAMAAAGAVSSLFADPAGGGGPLCLGIVTDDSLDAAPTGLTPEQAGNAAIIISVGQQWEVPQRGWVIAIATALQESNLVNLGDLGEDNDHDSLGLFQQRPSQGWGSPEQILNPEYAATVFYERLVQVPGWEELPLTVAAQQVQRSAFPNAYARHERRATQIVEAYLAGTLPSCVPPPVKATWRRTSSTRCGTIAGRSSSRRSSGTTAATPTRGCSTPTCGCWASIAASWTAASVDSTGSTTC
jgi:hypothetical protein